MRRFILPGVLVLGLAPAALAQTIPDHRDTVQRVYDSGTWNLAEHQSLCLFTDAVVKALYARDSNWRHLIKLRPRNGCYENYPQGHAVDVALYLPARKSVDFVIGAGALGAVLGWAVNTGDDYGVSDSFVPGGLPPPDPPTPPPPDPPVPDPPVPPIDLRPIVVLLEALGVEVNQLLATTAGHTRRIGELQAGLDALASRPQYTQCRAALAGVIPISCRLVP